jgi:predicted transposase YdaD
MVARAMPNPHDALVKTTFSQPEHAAGWFRHTLPPALAARLDFTTLTLRPGSYVDEALRERHSDLLFSITTTGGKPLLLYLLFEHQSTVDPLMVYRLLRYMVRIWEDYLAPRPEAKRLPPIVPLVLHHSATGWTASTAFQDALELDEEAPEALLAHVPRFRFVLDDISEATDEALRSRAMSALGRLALFCLRHGREPEALVAELNLWLDLVREVRGAPNGAAALRSIWQYILLVSERGQGKKEELVERLLLVVGQDEKEEIVSIADEFIEEGRNEGLREGLREGRREGRRQTLLKLLRGRFGVLPQAVVDRIEAADIAQLDAWVDRLLTAPTLDEAVSDG